MYWIEKLIPGCCAGRNNSQPVLTKPSLLLQDKHKSSSLDIKDHKNQENPKIIENSSKSEYSEEKKAVKANEELKKTDFKLRENSKCFNDSRTSTGLTTTSTELDLTVPTPEIILCSNCEKEAEGYCPSCPFSRYCASCFKTAHPEKKKFHLFIAYAIEKKKTLKDFENFQKMQKIQFV